MITKEIKLKIHEETDLYSEYDPDQNLLADDVAGYLQHNYLSKHRVSNEKYTIHIYSDEPVNEERVRTRIRDYFTMEKDNISYGIRKMTLKQIGLFFLGALIIGFWYFLSEKTSPAGTVKLEIISIIGGVAIWEAANIALMERPGLVLLRKAYDRIINARIVFDADVDTDGEGKS